MSTPNKDLSDSICSALQEAGVLSEKESSALKARILAGKVKPEDWALAVEKTLAENEKGAVNGK